MDPVIDILRKEFEVKLQTLAAEFRGTLDEIYVALTGISKGSGMALQVLNAKMLELEQKVTALESRDIPKVIPPNADTSGSGGGREL